MKLTRNALVTLGGIAGAFVFFTRLVSSGGSQVTEDPDGGLGFQLGDVYAETVGNIVAAVSAQNVSDAGIALIRGFEGCRLMAYYDVTGYSIGYGHKPASQGQTIDQATADAWCLSDASAAATAVLKYITVPLNQNQLDALADFVYNFGPGKLAGSTLRSVLNGGDYDQVPAQLARWNKVKDANGNLQFSPGASNRRAAEAQLWNTPVASTDGGDYASSGQYDPYGADDGSEFYGGEE